MDYDKLIDAVKLCGSTPKVDQCKQCAYWAGGDMSKCIPKMTADAALAIETFRADLALIEDILGEDYDLDRLRELVKMDRANSVPPCQIGDVFYAIDWSRWGSEVKEYRISMLQQKRDKAWRIRAKDTQSDYQVDWAYDDYRKQAYSTREAAEAALKAREQDG